MLLPAIRWRQRSYVLATLVVFHVALAASGQPSGSHTVFLNQGSFSSTEDPEVGDAFGLVMAVGDFDCDGFDDLAISAPLDGFLNPGLPDELWSAGLVHVFFGGAVGFDGRVVEFRESLFQFVGGTVEAGDQFGSSLAAGNFDGDTEQGHACDDLAIGVPSQDLPGDTRTVSDAGEVFVVYGGSNSVLSGGASLDTQAFNEDSPGVQGVVDRSEWFGLTLAAGDFNNDGYDELVIGTPNAQVFGRRNAGGVWVLRGGTGGLSAPAVGEGWRQYLTLDTTVGGGGHGSQEFALFGLGLAACDIDGDGIDDLAVGAPFHDFPASGAAAMVDVGATVVVFGSPTGFNSVVNATIAVGVEASEALGFSLAPAHVVPEVGVPQQSCELVSGKAWSSEGAVVGAGGFGLLRLQVGVLEEIDRWSPSSVGLVPLDEGELGNEVAAGDFNGDGLDELIVGADGYDISVRGGRGSTPYGGFVWLQDDVTHQFFDGELWAGSDAGRFGRALVTGDFDGDGAVDLAVGARDLAVGGIEQAGRVLVYLSQRDVIFLDGFENGDVAGWQ